MASTKAMWRIVLVLFLHMVASGKKGNVQSTSATPWTVNTSLPAPFDDTARDTTTFASSTTIKPATLQSSADPGETDHTTTPEHRNGDLQNHHDHWDDTFNSMTADEPIHPVPSSSGTTSPVLHRVGFPVTIPTLPGATSLLAAPTTPIADSNSQANPQAQGERMSHAIRITDITSPISDTTQPPTIIVETTMVATPLTDTLLTLMEEQLRLCGYKSFCTVETPTRPLSHTGCCEACSCDRDCLTNNTCCVDYPLKIMYRNVMFNSFADIQMAMTNTTYLTYKERLIEKIMKTNIRNSNAKRNSQDGSRCQSLQLVFKNQFTRPSHYYELVTGCMKSGLHSDNECLTEGLVPERLHDNIPVTSMTSGKTYKTKALFDCCGEANETFEYWDMLVECYTLYNTVDFLPDYVPNQYMLLDNRHLLANCYVVFEPSDFIRNHGLVPNVCQNTDIDTCPFKPTNERELYLMNVCESVHHFVRVMDQVSPITYKNVACVLCNNGNHTSKMECQEDKDIGEAMKLRLNLGDTSRNPLPMNELPTDDLLDINALSGFSSYENNCPSGYIYVPILSECRRLYCPRSMYIVNGACAPVYDHVTGATFKTAFNMTIISGMKTSVTNSLFEEAFKSFLKQEHFRTIELTIARIRTIKQRYTYMVEFLLSPKLDTSVTMSSVVDAVTSWYYTTVDIQVSDNIVVQMGISPGVLAYFKESRSRPIRAETIFTLKDKTSWDIRQALHYTIGISESFSCYRIALKIESFIFPAKHVITIPIINKTLFREDYDSNSITEELLVCVDLFSNQTRYFRTKARVNTDDIINRMFNARASIADMESKVLVLVVIGSVVGGVILCITVRLIMKTVSRRNNNSQTSFD